MNYRYGRPRGTMRNSMERGDARKFSGNDLRSFLRVGVQTTLASTKISAIDDIGAYGNGVTQGTDANRPTFNAAGANGRPYASSSGVLPIGFAFADVFSSLTAAEVFVVFNVASDPPTVVGKRSALWEMSSGGSGEHFPFTDGVIYDGFGSTVRKTTGDPSHSMATPVVYNVVSISGEWTSYINGVAHFTTATNTVGFSSAPKLMRTISVDGLEGNFYQFVLYGTKLDQSARTRRTNADIAYYGLS